MKSTLATTVLAFVLQMSLVTVLFAQDTEHDSILLKGIGSKIRFDVNGDATSNFKLFVNESVFELDGDSTRIFSFARDAPIRSLSANSSGVGIGTPDPSTPLHVVNDSDERWGVPSALFLVENQVTPAAVRNLLTLSNFGGARFALQNSSTGKRWVISTDNNDTLFWTEANSADPTTAPYFRMFLNDTSSTILAQMGHLGESPAKFSFMRNGNLNIVGNISEGSDRNVKEHFRAVDSQEILRKISELPITTWNYIRDEDSVRHMGPMAQDFRATFGLGKDDVSIAGIDKDGVALAAIQALNKNLNQTNKDLRNQLEEQASRIEQLESLVGQMLEK